MKKIQQFSFVILLFIIGSSASYGQLDRIEMAIEDGNLKRALNLIESAEEDDILKKNPELYFMKADVYFGIIRHEFLSTKYEDALKLGIKALEKGRYKAEGEFFPEYLPLVDSFVKLNNEKGAAEYKINKYTKAIKSYDQSFSLNGDMTAIYWKGKSYLMSYDTLLGEDEFNKVIVYGREQKAEGNDVDKVMSDAFVYFADKYWQLQKYDSANLYLESARKVFGGNVKIDYFQKEVTKQQIDQLPPSSLMMEKIKYILNFFPTDTVFVKKENALYLYLMRKNYDNGELVALDTMLARFTVEKVERYKSELVNQYKKGDQFIEDKHENVLWKLVKYYSKFDYPGISNYMAQRYIEATAKEKNPEAIQARYTVIIDYAAKSHSLKLANQLLEHAESMYGAQATLTGIRKSLISKNKAKDLNTSEQGALYTMLMKENEIASLSEDVQKLVEKYIEALVREKDYRTARSVILAHANGQPDNPIWNRKIDYLAKEDFYHNYYMTRVKEEVVAGMTVGGFTWNGSKTTCNPGDIDPKIQQKVEDRINYFRRQAGVPDIYLDPELNDWCQKAALMMEANKSLSHTPDSRWSCYTDEGADAARYSLLTKGANTTMAVTSFFADNANPNVGNRRWLLYPNGLALGHGSTENACAIWASDDSGSVDSNTYKEQFVAWPPEGTIPKMMVFNYWSFSIQQDLKGSTVTMTIDGKSIPLTIQPYEEGHRLPTLVWQPTLDIKSLTGDTEVLVNVDLPNGRRYTYMIKVLDFNAIGY